MIRFIVKLVLTAALFCCAPISWAENDLIRVGTKLSVPFTIEQDDTWNGVAFDLWSSMAADQGIDYSVTSYPTVDELLKAVAAGKVDVGVGSITVNAEREKTVDFSHAYFTTGLGIATTQAKSGLWATMTALATPEFFSAVFSLFVVLFIVGIAIWLLERHKNKEHFGGNTVQGLGNGFWWSAVTMTTVGYGDKAPVTFLGRFLGVIWMFVSVITISGFTAAIASSITVNSLSTAVTNIDDLYRVNVATVSGSSSVDFLQNQGIRHTAYNNVDELVEALANKEIDAAVYDISLLKYKINERGYKQLKILPDNLLAQDYAFAFQENSGLIESTNRLLLEKVRSADWQTAIEGYFGSNN